MLRICTNPSSGKLVRAPNGNKHSRQRKFAAFQNKTVTLTTLDQAKAIAKGQRFDTTTPDL